MRFEPFVGRAAQLSQLQGWAQEAAATGIGRFVIVTGEAGAGKTRLCAEFRGQLRERKFGVAWSRCWAGGGGPPLWPWPDLVAELGEQCAAATRLDPLGGTSDRFGLFRTVADQLRGLCSDRPAVAMVEDLHVANQDVVLLTRFVARSVHRFPLVLVATWRTPPAREPPELLASLGGDGTTLALPPFGPIEVAEYYAQVRSRDPAPDEIATLLAWSRGNPMYLAELLRPGGGEPLGDGLALALARRVAGLPTRHRRVLGVAALLAPEATLAQTARVAGCSDSDVLAAVQEAGSAAMVVDGTIHFSHDLVRAALVQALPERTRHELHAAARDDIAGDGTGAVVRRAHHAVQAAGLSTDDAARAARECERAASALYRTLIFEEAADWGATGSRLAAAGTDRNAEATLLLTQADAVLACGRLGVARQLYERAVRPAQEAGDPRLLARAALGLGGVWVEEQRDELSRRRMLGLCRRALAALPRNEASLAARLKVRLAAEKAYDGTARDEVGAAMRAAKRVGDGPAIAEALSLYHHTLMVPEQAAARLAVAEELVDVASQADASMYSAFAVCWRTVDLYLLGDDRAERAFIDVRERATALGNQAVGYIVATLEVMRAFRRGELDKAEALAAEALTLGTAVGDADALSWYGAHLLAIRWVQGRLGELLDVVAPIAESSTLRRLDQIYPALMAYATAVQGRREAARSLLDGLLADGLDGIRPFSTWNATMTVLVETAVELDDVDLAAQLAPRFAPVAHLPVMPSMAVTCLGPGERVMARACAGAGHLDEAVTWFRAAVRANRRLRNRPFDAIIRAELAATLVRRNAQGDHEEATGMYAAAIELAGELGLDARRQAWQVEAATIRHAPAHTPVRNASLARCKGGWRIDMSGHSAVVEHLIGMAYVAELLARPDTDIAATELSAALAGGGVVAEGDAPLVLDDEARERFRRRLGELDRELERADRGGDVDRGQRAAAERAELVGALRRDTGLGGRPRRMPGVAERSRMRVSKAIRRAIERVGAADPVLGRTLASNIKTGYVCRYVSDPDHPVVWTVRHTDPGLTG